MVSRNTTQARLEAALKRLLDGKPERVRKAGKLSLNRINNEAGLGHSYIHKFEDFVERAKPLIKEFNQSYDSVLDVSANDKNSLTAVEVLKCKLKKERELKEKYRKERDDAIVALKEIEKLNSTLMFRVYELQDIARINDLVYLSR
ncbi:hypothetical protein L1267_04975 [Pseudoalteromonas sp. OFAV1]|uniref:hypothetical protein n=1 Tax=Pseudoalteromonas sp. OFAV1 TaxID=2908892 RepID=UPI001F3256C4|nr:hypothetical protein [Pseudoalteromonas sp. OFAV1]MCF2899765.1 hypothetical protein [Pseudoalteromonas sp. OFAV1]